MWSGKESQAGSVPAGVKMMDVMWECTGLRFRAWHESIKRRDIGELREDNLNFCLVRIHTAGVRAKGYRV